MKYKNESGSFRSDHDGTKLFYQRWQPDNPVPGRNIAFHHGFGDHSDRYGNLLESFRETGFTFYSFDARGHGRSEGKRGDAINFQEFVGDLENFLLLIRRQFQVKKPILLGHSMGGLAVTSFALSCTNQWEVSALVTSAAALRVNQTALMKVKRSVGIIIRDLYPELSMAAGINAKFLSHDPDAVQAYKQDPLVHGQISARMALAFLETGEDVIRRAPLLQIPLYMAQGTGDEIAAPSGTIEFFTRCSSENKRLNLYRGLYHEIFNEPPWLREQPLLDLKEWVMNFIGEQELMSAGEEPGS